LGLSQESNSGNFQSPPTEVVAHVFASPGGKDSMKMERGEMCNAGQCLQIKFLIEMYVDVFKYAMQPR
jgi:hypothetical protein